MQGIDIDVADCIIDVEYKILFRDHLLQRVQDKLRDEGITESEAIIKASEIVDTVEAKDFLVLDSWAAHIEKDSCEGCPAFQWVIHKDGLHSCRLGFAMHEKEGQGKPVNPCLRPQTVGGSYQIAKALGRPEPMVGKLDKWQHDQYITELEALGKE